MLFRSILLPVKPRDRAVTVISISQHACGIRTESETRDTPGALTPAGVNPGMASPTGTDQLALPGADSGPLDTASRNLIDLEKIKRGQLRR